MKVVFLILPLILFSIPRGTTEASRKGNVADNDSDSAISKPAGNDLPVYSPIASEVKGGGIAQAANSVCPDPARPCHHKSKRFDEWELSFKMPARLKANTTYRSEPFYGLIIKSYPLDEDCDGGEFIEEAEVDRNRAQAIHTSRKVFGSYECPNMAAVNYEFDGKWDANKENLVTGNFIAIYIGRTKSEADQASRNLKNDYPRAQLKRMTATYEVIKQ